jgi:magnesium-transporting ATPase (P-type)
MLTGDRMETATNIGFSCKLLNERMNLIEMSSADLMNAEQCRQFLKEQCQIVKSHLGKMGRLPETYINATSVVEHTSLWRRFARRHETQVSLERVSASRAHKQTENLDNGHNAFKDGPFALIIDGATLTHMLQPHFERQFLELATLCTSVLCCRVSPLQKAQVVQLVRRHLDASTLAIGDGANDVTMIQAAHVGVGISGKEGLQAARSADFAISKVILYCFCKS